MIFTLWCHGAVRPNIFRILRNFHPWNSPVFSRMRISCIKIRQSWDRLIFIMGDPIPVRRLFFLSKRPLTFLQSYLTKSGTFYRRDVSKIVACLQRLKTVLRSRLICSPTVVWFHTLAPKQNGYHATNDILECMFLNENVWLLIRSSRKLFLMVMNNSNPPSVKIMVWWWIGYRPRSDQELA